ncbi:MAG: hypothetical protein AUK55_11885 [Syntrophobacteraceae bacterium CG2_30_61_12]|nr:MAG: hypothetical protein AUK55_11885 [Syntrophobacteraceae bacterium CG2_30_61_12]
MADGDAEPGERLDAYLGRRHPDISRNRFKQLIQTGAVQVNQRTVRPRYLPVCGDRVEVRLPPADPREQLIAEAMPLDILYEDAAILVVNKPPGLVVHPGAGHEHGTLVHGLLAHCPRLAAQGAPLRPGIVHRLDQDTSGALVVAKTDRAYLNLINQFKMHSVSKEYLALVYGHFAGARGTLTDPIGRHPVNRQKMAVVAGGREAVSHWVVVEVLGPLTLVRVSIETGRTHQIRVHLSHIGHPVVGDVSYGGGRGKARCVGLKAIRELLPHLVRRQLLHAGRLAIEHPESGERMVFEAPLPADFEDVLKALRTAVRAGAPH